MGIDTCKFRSPYISDVLGDWIERQGVKKQGIHLGTGELIYEFTTTPLEGSWDSRIYCRVMREEWVKTKGGGLTAQPCPPYIEIEASLHKFFRGQNIYGAPVNFQQSAFDFLTRVFNELGIQSVDAPKSSVKLHRLPSFKKWSVCRIDWAEVFNLSTEAQLEFHRGIALSKFPRRGNKTQKRPLSFYSAGAYSTFKIYHKGEEFKEHDKLRIKNALTMYAEYQLDMGNYLTDVSQFQTQAEGRIEGRILWSQWVAGKLKALQRLANNRMRVEVEIKADKLKNDFDLERLPLIEEIEDKYLIGVYEKEVFKLLREGKADMQTVRKNSEVLARLQALHTPRQVKSLYGFYKAMATDGEDVVRQLYSDSQFYAQRKKLVESGISWQSTDLVVIGQDTALPKDFSPVIKDVRRCFKPVRSNACFFDFHKLAA